MTNQEIFDKVAQHLMAQKQRSIKDNVKYKCRYYGPNGLKCAVGCLIPSEKYDPAFENKTLAYVLGEIGLHEHYDLLSRLQTIHDSYYPDRWKDLLKVCAERFNLSTEVLCQP